MSRIPRTCLLFIAHNTTIFAKGEHLPMSAVASAFLAIARIVLSCQHFHYGGKVSYNGIVPLVIVSMESNIHEIPTPNMIPAMQFNT